MGEKVQEKKTEGDIVIRKCLGFPCMVQGINRNKAGIQGEKDGLFMAFQAGAYVNCLISSLYSDMMIPLYSRQGSIGSGIYCTRYGRFFSRKK